MPKRFAIIGPESSGKSTLTQELAEHFDEPFLPEYGRIYLEAYGPNYTYEDLEKICRKMVSLDALQIQNAQKMLFCDTDLMMMKVWYEVKFNQVSPFLLAQLDQIQYDFYFICAPDLPWQEDPVRENPHLRTVLFERYIKEANASNTPYTIITGKDRLQVALRALEANGEF